MRLSETATKAAVKVQGINSPVFIPITNPQKPSIEKEIIKKWQKIIDLMADCIGVPAALIMQVHTDHITVFLTSASEGNPYTQGASDSLLHGLYCETVLGKDQQLIIPNAIKDNDWNKNPDIKLGMISYLGFPIKWPDGDFFGTICVLDTQENEYEKRYILLLETIKESIEKDLHTIFMSEKELQLAYNQLEKKVTELEESQKKIQAALETKSALIQEIHHRVKNNLQFISSLLEMQLDCFGKGPAHDQLLTIHNRILSMKIVHNMLYKSQDFTKIKIYDYTTTLIKNIQNSLISDYKTIQLLPNISQSLSTNLDTAIYIGLIINELLSNSFKHAFPDTTEGTISIEIQPNYSGGLSLKISDDGIGLSPDINTENKHGLGFKIVENLTLQLNGKFTIVPNEITKFEITIPNI